jgi:RNA polymerase sigma-70 factor (ECF subfamily)
MGNEPEQERMIELMISYQAGEIEAFESLYQLLRRPLFQYLLYRTFDHVRAEDLLQESFLQLHRSRRTYLPGKPVLPWAIAIARHVFLMERRAGHTRERHESPAEDSMAQLSIPDELNQIVDRQMVRNALFQLSSDQREILWLHHAWGMSFREISGILGIGRSAAKLRAHRAIKILREILSGNR